VKIWRWITNKDNQSTVLVLCAVAGLLGAGAWNVFTHIWPPEESPKEPPISIDSVSGGIVNFAPGNTFNQYNGIPLDDYRALAEELGVTKEALKSFFEILQHKNVPKEELGDYLRKIAKQYKELESKLKNYTSDDPVIVKLKQGAATALRDGDFAKAEQLLNQASERDIQQAKEFKEIADSRLASAASALAEIAELKDTQLAYAEAASYFRKAANLAPPNNQEIIATYLNNEGMALYSAGEYAQAQDSFEQAWKIFETALGADHPSTLTSMNNLARTLSDMGDHAGAKVLEEQVLEQRKEILGADHPDTLTSMNNLASTLSDMGDHAGAKTLHEQVLEKRKEILGAEHPSTLISMNNLASTLWAMGDNAGAKVLHEQVLEKCCTLLGARHPDTTISAWNLYCSGQPFPDSTLGVSSATAGAIPPLL